MKKIEDYLHLYVGADVALAVEDFDYSEKLVGIHPVTEGVRYLTADRTGAISYRKSENIKPLLRPLSDMTEEERYKCQYNAQCFFLKETGPLDTDSLSIEQAAIVTNYLIKQGFDLFELIEAGLAMDKTKLS